MAAGLEVAEVRGAGIAVAALRVHGHVEALPGAEVATILGAEQAVPARDDVVVHDTRAVVVDAVADLGGPGVDAPVGGHTILVRSVAVPVGVVVTEVSLPVRVEVRLVWVHDERAVVVIVGDAVVVVVAVYAVGVAVRVGVGESLVHVAVAVLIGAVTDLGLRLRRIADDPPFEAYPGAVAGAPDVRAHTGEAVGDLVGLSVAVVVDAVAGLRLGRNRGALAETLGLAASGAGALALATVDRAGGLYAHLEADVGALTDTRIEDALFDEVLAVAPEILAAVAVRAVHCSLARCAAETPLVPVRNTLRAVTDVDLAVRGDPAGLTEAVVVGHADVRLIRAWARRHAQEAIRAAVEADVDADPRPGDGVADAGLALQVVVAVASDRQ